MEITDAQRAYMAASIASSIISKNGWKVTDDGSDDQWTNRVCTKAVYITNRIAEEFKKQEGK